MDNSESLETDVAEYLSSIAAGVRIPKRDLKESVRKYMSKLGQKGGKANGECKKRDMDKIWQTRRAIIERKKLKKQRIAERKALAILT